MCAGVRDPYRRGSGATAGQEVPLSMPSMGKRMRLANPQDGRDDVTEGIHGRAARVERAASECSRA
jgi:hypothetical protein